MSSSPLRNVLRVDVPSWLFEGEFHEDTQYYVEAFYIVAHCNDGAYVHEVTFPDDLEGAERLARRVEEKGFINLKHWGFHEFFSLSLEERLMNEAHHEDLHRKGYGHLSNGVFSGGHA
jgi:hypothetical protein